MTATHGRSAAGEASVLIVVALLTACGPTREGTHLSKSDPIAFSALRDAIANDARRESRLFRRAAACAATKDQPTRFAECRANLESTTLGWIGETSLVVGLVDPSEATAPCRAAIMRLRAEEDRFTDVPTIHLVEALYEPSVKLALERVRGRWFSVRAARKSAVYQCR